MITNFSYEALRGFCRKIYGDIPLLLTPTVYQFDFGTVAAGQQVTRSVQINANCDFVLLDLRYVSNESQADPSPTLQITDSSNSNTLFNIPAPVHAVAGFPQVSAMLGASLHYPYWIGANTGIIGQLQSLGANPMTLTVVDLIGFNIRELI